MNISRIIQYNCLKIDKYFWRKLVYEFPNNWRFFFTLCFCTVELTYCTE